MRLFLAKRSRRAGFTLLETLAALFILIVVITGVTSVMFRVFNAANFAAKRLTAAYLAQEGLELVRNMRDRAFLEQREGAAIVWDQYIQAGTFALDYRSRQLPDGTCAGQFLAVLPGGFYACTGDSSAPYRRAVSITKVDLDTDPDTIERLEISSTVSWQDAGVQRNLSAKENLYDWLR